MSSPKYGALESNPARFTDNEAWMFQHYNVWREMNAAGVHMRAGLMTEAEYRKAFDDLLPKGVFQSLPNSDRAHLLAPENPMAPTESSGTAPAPNTSGSTSSKPVFKNSVDVTSQNLATLSALVGAEPYRK
jgi:hypothetical protein